MCAEKQAQLFLRACYYSVKSSAKLKPFTFSQPQVIESTLCPRWCEVIDLNPTEMYSVENHNRGVLDFLHPPILLTVFDHDDEGLVTSSNQNVGFCELPLSHRTSGPRPKPRWYPVRHTKSARPTGGRLLVSVEVVEFDRAMPETWPSDWRDNFSTWPAAVQPSTVPAEVEVLLVGLRDLHGPRLNPRLPSLPVRRPSVELRVLSVGRTDPAQNQSTSPSSRPSPRDPSFGQCFSWRPRNALE